MKKTISIFVLLSISLLSYSQEQKIKISFQSGYFKGGDYKRIQPGINYGLDASYFLSNHFFVTAHFNYGTNDFYEDRWTNYPDIAINPDNGTNAVSIINNIGLLTGYYLPITHWANLTGQIGFSQIIRVSDRFPVRIYDPDLFLGYNDRTDYSVTLFSTAFPAKFSLGFTPFNRMNAGFAKNIEIGYVFGFYMSPDSGAFSGLYHGPQLSIAF